MNRTVNKLSVLVIVFAASFVTAFTSSAVNIALPRMAADLRIDAVSLGWVSTIYTLATAAFMVPMGRIADIVGRKRIFVSGVALYGLSTICSATASSGTTLILCRAVEGAGAAMIYATSTALLTSVFPVKERGGALGISVAAVYVGLSIGPTAGGLLTQHLGWRSLFWVAAPLAALTVALMAWRVQGEWAEARGEPFDALGSAVYGAGLAALMYGVKVLPQAPGVWLILLGTSGLVGFVLWEARAKSPVLEVSLFRRNTAFALSNLAAWLIYGGTTAVGFLLSLYLQYIKGLEPQQAGLVMVAQPLVQAIFSPLAGQLSDRVQPRIVVSAGMGLTVIGLVLLAGLDTQTSMAYIVACLLLLGFGFALFSSPNMNAIMSSVDRKRYGLASGMVGTMRATGQTFSMGVAMLIFAIRVGPVQITPEHFDTFLSSARIIFAGSAVLCLGGMSASLARGKVLREPGV